MKSEKRRFNRDFKEKLSKELYQIAIENEDIFKEMLRNSGVDTSKIEIIDRSRYMVKYIPDVLEELLEKYGSDFSLKNPEMMEETRELIEKKLHEDLPTPKIWNVNYILLHCKIPRPINIEKNIQVVPFDGWPCDDYIKVLDKIAGQIGSVASDYSDEIWKSVEDEIRSKFGEKNPVSLLIFKKVNAEGRTEAYEKTKDYAESITTSLSVLINSSIEIKGWLFEGQLNGLIEIYPDIFFWHYEHIYTEPDSLEENTKLILEVINKNYLIKLALKYENEALADSEENFRILKRWSALEYISDEYSRTSPQLLSKEDRNKIIEFIMEEIIEDKSPKIKAKVQNNVGQINRRSAKDKVRDLLKWCDYSLKKLDDNKDVIDVIYQHRNCITHSGGCYKYDSAIEECRGPAYCKKSELIMEDLNRELSRMLKAFIGKHIGVKFKYRQKIPEDIKRLYK